MARAAAAAVMVVVVVAGVAGVSWASENSSTVARTDSDSLTTAETQQSTVRDTPIERTLQTIIINMQENHKELQSSVRDVVRAVRRTQREVAELRDDTDLILAQMYKPSCQEVAEDLYETLQGRRSDPIIGVYTIKPPKHKPKQVRCELSRGAMGWTVIVSRSNGREMFNRTYREYREGFGDPSNEYWIGNNILHRLTTWRPHLLRAIMEDFSGQKTWVQYNVFRVAGPEDDFRLTVDEFEADSAAGDGLKIHNGMKFSTYDKDDDANEDGNCAQLLGGGGGWWYSNCYHVLPTGQYRPAGTSEYGGIAWYPWKDIKYSLKAITLLIRPR